MYRLSGSQSVSQSDLMPSAVQVVWETVSQSVSQSVCQSVSQSVLVPNVQNVWESVSQLMPNDVQVVWELGVSQS